MKTYHERIAHAMSRSVSAGSLNTYDEILAALKRKYPAEEQLRAVVATLEARLRLMGLMPDNLHFPDDARFGFDFEDEPH